MQVEWASWHPFKKDAIKESVACVLNGDFTIQERTLLSIRTEPEINSLKELNFALNEITIARKNTTSMIGVQTYLNKEYLTNYWADGLIIATPTGSTGYSLKLQWPGNLTCFKKFGHHSHCTPQLKCTAHGHSR